MAIPHLSWIQAAQHALKQSHTLPTQHAHITIRCQWVYDLPAPQITQLQDMLTHAYDAGHSMWEYFEGNLTQRQNVLVFTLHAPGSAEILATRSVGHTYWADEYWSAHARHIGQNPPIAGACFTVKRPHRDQGLASLLWHTSTTWLKRHGIASAIFGDTVSRRALAMYARKNAWLFLDDVRRICAAHGAGTFQEMLHSTRHAERIASEDGIRYVWPLADHTHEPFLHLGYCPAAQLPS